MQIKLLLDAGADKSLTNDLSETPYDWAVKFSAPEETLSLLKIETTPVAHDESQHDVGGDPSK